MNIIKYCDLSPDQSEMFDKYDVTDIPDYPEEFRTITYPDVKRNKYAISNYGRVLNLKTGRIMKTYYDKDDHEKITLVGINKRSMHVFIHRLVLYQFVGFSSNPEYTIVHHKNNIPCCNFLHNLEWTSVALNTFYAKKCGALNNRGTSSTMCKYDETLIRRICYALQDGKSNIEIYHEITGDYNYKTTGSGIYNLINKLHRRTSYRDIVCDYDYFPDINKFAQDDISKEIRELIVEGYSNLNIMKHFGYNACCDNRTFYNKIISERSNCQVLYKEYKGIDYVDDPYIHNS